MSELQSNGVNIYQFPIDDESVLDVNSQMNAHVPFAVVGSTDFVRVGNKMMRSRQYPWGTVQVENESHCDFVKLREMLIRTNMEDMREKTHGRHYELYRKKRLEQVNLLNKFFIMFVKILIVFLIMFFVYLFRWVLVMLTVKTSL